MKKTIWILLTVALCCLLIVPANADDFNFGEVDKFDTTAADETTEPAETEPSTEEVTTEPEPETSTEEVTTEPESESDTSESEQATTEFDDSESGEETTEPDASASEEVTTEPDASESGVVTTEPDASGTDAPVTTRPAESETEDDEETPWMLPIPVIFITIGVVGVGGIVVLVILLRMYFRAQQDEENK